MAPLAAAPGSHVWAADFNFVTHPALDGTPARIQDAATARCFLEASGHPSDHRLVYVAMAASPAACPPGPDFRRVRLHFRDFPDLRAELHTWVEAVAVAAPTTPAALLALWPAFKRSLSISACNLSRVARVRHLDAKAAEVAASQEAEAAFAEVEAGDLAALPRAIRARSAAASAALRAAVGPGRRTRHSWLRTRERPSPIITQQALAALQAAPAGRAPGVDDIPGELYQECAPALAAVLAALFSAVLAVDQVPRGFLDGVLSCFHKPGDPTEPENYRPIMLLDTDYRTLARVLARCLLPVLRGVIEPEQTAFLTGRRIADNILLLQLLPALAWAEEQPGVVVAFLDFYKAYDTLDRAFLVACLEAIGVGTGFLAWVRRLLAGTRLAALVNGRLFAFVPITGGVCQGCPLSPALYLVPAQALLSWLKSCDVGINLASIHLAASQFADDCTAFLASAASLPAFLECMDVFRAASGQRLNLAKAVVGIAGERRGEALGGFGLLPLVEHVRGRHAALAARCLLASAFSTLPPPVIITPPEPGPWCFNAPLWGNPFLPGPAPGRSLDTDFADLASAPGLCMVGMAVRCCLAMEVILLAVPAAPPGRPLNPAATARQMMAAYHAVVLRGILRCEPAALPLPLRSYTTARAHHRPFVGEAAGLAPAAVDALLPGFGTTLRRV
ncbi:LINE-1 reverse transcriptase [Tetrabaena socialis]|uniref:LINE-1 reverse transcriptase n=1 Tax=Tetrabaena socialis TaxID=47790 RepID=A0A2J7ZLA0_9CHLO|nr:LINE-1 reverse transcriptase [Tetrabaena socialis]|eukprot:PNH01047.1 LINE-1 reverse transcriptase [Tetrabaena socialis]